MKTLTTLLFICVTIFSLYAQNCLNGNCKSGDGVFKTKEGDIYQGQFKNGQFEGIGTMKFVDGSTYRGQWSNNLPNGKGFKTLADKTILSGDWVDGQLARADQLSNAKVQQIQSEPTKDVQGCLQGDCANGQGIFVFRTGAVYVGDFKNGEIHGSGVCDYPDGGRYEGQWKHRFPDGYGTLNYANSTSRTGYWKKGLPVDENGNFLDEELTERGIEETEIDLQIGCIFGDCDIGQGIYAYPDGSRYEGAFQTGLPHGNGVFYSIEGEKYVGAFESGQRSGKGKVVFPDGSSKKGVWLDGDYIGQSIGGITNKSIGCVSGNCRNGYGTYNFKEGGRYIGPFENGRPNGVGTVFFKHRKYRRYEGEMREGRIEGYGTLFLANGGIKSGLWSNGSFVKSDQPTRPAPIHEPQKPRSRPANPAVASKVKVWAVIVGVATYNHMPVLRYTDDDAYRIYAFLKSPEGGALDDSQIRILIDEEATKNKIKRTMNDLFAKAGPNDLVLMYFSGHGVKGAFLPSDFDGYDNKLKHEEINAIFRGSRAKYKLCIADACHSGSIFTARGGDMPTSSVLSSYYESLAKAHAGTALIMSSKSNETSLESSGLRQGVFSHYLIRGLKGEADKDYNNLISVGELFRYIDINVRDYTRNRQSPMIQGDYDPKMTVAVKSSRY
jgi:hypothetical protein